MKGRSVFGLMFSGILLLLVAGSGLAREPQPIGSSGVVGVDAGTAANAPWFTRDVDTPGNTGQYTSLAVDPSNGDTYISYYDATSQALRMAKYVGSGGNCGPNNEWECQTVDSGPHVGKYSSIAINPVTGNPGIAYHDETGGSLKYYAYCIGPCIPRVTIDGGLPPFYYNGRYTSLKYNSNGTPYIAYYFETIGSDNDGLKVASGVVSSGNCGTGTAAGKWQCDIIKTGEGVGQYASLALDGAGNRHIAYYDGDNGDLWYAKSVTGSNCGPGNTWTCYPVDALDDVGQYASLYVDSGNRFHIAYYDATSDALKYAVDRSGGGVGNCGVLGSAQCDTIDDMPTGIHPVGVSMAEFYAGYPIIAYQSADGSLNVARPAAVMPGKSLNCAHKNPIGYTWYCETIKRYQIGPTRHGDFVSIDLNSAGLATIAYYGYIRSSSGNLMVSYQRFQFFLPVVVKNQ